MVSALHYTSPAPIPYVCALHTLHCMNQTAIEYFILLAGELKENGLEEQM